MIQHPITVGAAENIVEVPLFAELVGYGPFIGRRNLGVRDPLYCRVMTVNDGIRRNVIIVTDIVSSEQLPCRLLRMELAEQFALFPDSIMFVGTHTHSGPIPAEIAVGYGEPSAEFHDNWRRTVIKTVREAIASEEEVKAFAGKAKIRKPIGQRRTAASDDQHADPEIRFVKFIRKDGSVKLLLHNYAMHGVVFGRQPYVSADWMGDANAKIKARKLAEIPFFLYGTAGDINVIWTHSTEERDKNLDWIGTSYVDDLENDLDKCEEISLEGITADLKAFEFPTEPVDSEVYRSNADIILAKAEKSPEFATLLTYMHDRMYEMAELADRGHDFRVIRDLQVLKMGDLSIFAIPGEPFLAVGEELREKSNAKFPLAVSVANGHASYYPTKEMFEKYPSIFDCDDFGAFGFFEVYFGPGSLRAKFQSNIVSFITENLLKMEEKL